MKFLRRRRGLQTKNRIKSYEKRYSSGWRGSPLVATLHVIELLIVWGHQRDQVANAVIEARPH